MSMEEWPDDHLDELFRKSAEEFDVPFNADDWADLSRRLDKHDRQTVFDRISRWGGIGALVLLLLGGLGWIMYDEKPITNHQQPVITVLTPARKPGGQPDAASQSAKTVAHRDKDQVKALSPEPDADSQPVGTNGGDKRPEHEIRTNGPAGQGTTNTIEDQLITSTGRRKSRSAIDRPMTNEAVAPAEERETQLTKAGAKAVNKQTRKNTARLSTRKRIERSGNELAVDRHSVDKPSRLRSAAKTATRAADTYLAPTGNVPGNGAENQSGGPVQTAGAEETVTTEPAVDSQWMPALTPATTLSTVVQQVRALGEPTPPAVSVNVPARQSIPRLSRLSVMLFASPDLSSIGLKNFDRPGTNAGLAIQYQLTDRLSVNAGAMYSTKRYQTNASEYVWPSYMNMEVWPETISGLCKMIDIPVNLRYDWLLRRRGDGRAPARWFASAGLTSYFIQHEVYNYQFANPADPKIKYWGWDNQRAGRPGGSFGFSNLNVSVGYEHPITNRLSWQVEPFMKVPLKQVGYFKIRLLSTGAFVGLRYRL